MTASKETPIYSFHQAAGAKMVPFAGYQMPMEYTGILQEHKAVRQAMGIFDVSHMGEIEIKGKNAVAFSQQISTNDVAKLRVGRVQYSAILNDEGGMLDDCTLYRLGEEHLLFVVNAASRQRVIDWFTAHPMEGATVEDRSEDYALMALQGRKAEALLNQVLQKDFSALRFYDFTWVEAFGTALLISRTGYTGEDGFEIYLAPNKAAEVWAELMKVGGPYGLVPVGLGARDTLRLEMGYLLYGSDMDVHTTPLEAGIGWVVKMEKGFFHGRDRLQQQKEEGLKKKNLRVEVIDRGIPRPHYPVEHDGVQVGEVTSGTFSPSLEAGIALALVKPSVKLNAQVEVKARNRGIAAQVVRPPFVEGSIKR